MEFEHEIIYFSVPKRGGAIIRGGATFGGNMVHILSHSMEYFLNITFR